jgi:hypothetical protein
MLFSETFSVCFENHTKHTGTPFGRKAWFYVLPRVYGRDLIKTSSRVDDLIYYLLLSQSILVTISYSAIANL